MATITKTYYWLKLQKPGRDEPLAQGWDTREEAETALARSEQLKAAGRLRFERAWIDEEVLACK